MAKTVETVLERVGYSPTRDVIALHLSTGVLVEIPRLAIKELKSLDRGQLRALKPDNAGLTLSQRELDIEIYLPGLLGEMLGITPGAVLGRKGGATRSPAKRRASQQNGRRGGRPKKKLGRAA